MPDARGTRARQRVAVVGLGPIGTKVVEALDRNVKTGVSQLVGEMSQYIASHPQQSASAQ